jgi:hypothetical protein
LVIDVNRWLIISRRRDSNRGYRQLQTGKLTFNIL